ncbi:MAG: hypothetical protein VKJ46_09785 [Leptolyngbyaceae bacterium]|nr:hypothetical protein [Leptolyngbyaceae bacterium]
MLELACAVTVPSTPQELEEAIRYYRSSDLSGLDLYCQWQAIRDAALTQKSVEPVSDKVSGEDSY